MSSTSWEGGESLRSAPLFFSPIFPLLLFAATAAAGLRGTYMYYISNERHNNLPLHTHTLILSLSLSGFVCVFLTHSFAWDYLSTLLGLSGETDAMLQ